MVKYCQLWVMLLPVAGCLPRVSSATGQTNRIAQLAPCLSSVSCQDTEPPETCCEALSSVLVETPSCLCEIIETKGNSTTRTGLPSININLVKQLPKECNVVQLEKTDESHCPGHENSEPGAKSASVKAAFAPSALASFTCTILIFTGVEFHGWAKFYQASHRDHRWDGLR
ncbi:hypothetical protein R1sor_019388 [Riccia sorocarpa]|uniref:Bifunctional inhibitor/plant lipid transfer protein/seed storage helical domain-containing protein n=1 Tax=Riccia sorocarpa TaxID=122646 RepID=A0ABD3IGI9_9MARC